MQILNFFCRNCRKRESQGQGYIEVHAGEKRENVDSKVSAIDLVMLLEL